MTKLDATKLIPDLDSSRVAEWVGKFKSLVNTKKAVALEHYINGGILYTVGEDNAGYYFLEVDDEVVYFVRYRQIKAGGNTFGRQVLVARLANRAEATKVAAHVFFKYLLPRFGALCSDTEQTRHGQGFWSFVLTEAFHKKLHVYAYDRRVTPNTLTPLQSIRDLNQQLTILWGTDNGHKRTHAVISKRPVAIIPKEERKR